MSSTHASPPRKRVRSSTSAMIGDAPTTSASASGVGASHSERNNHSQNMAVNPEAGGPTGAAAVSTRSQMKLKHSGGRSGRRHGGSNANNANYMAEHPGEEPSGSSSEECEDESDLTQSLLRKVPTRSDGLSSMDREVVRLIGQHLMAMGLQTSADVLMRETGCRLDQPSAAVFRKHVQSAEWAQAVKALESLKPFLENPVKIVEMKYLLLEQKYLEFLSQRRQIEALKVLQTELTPLNHRQSRTHELSTYLMLSKTDDIARVTRSVRGGEKSRPDLMERLQSFFPASVMLPPHRLDTLLSQAAKYQIDRCLFHNQASSSSDAASTGGLSTYLSSLGLSCLALDHQCSKENFPHETIQVLSDHCEETWYCKFSKDGLRLATGSKDMTVIVWDFDPKTLTFTKYRVLERHSHGVSFFVWSPDGTKLAICGTEDCDEVVIWNIDNKDMEGRISNSNEDSLASVSWSPDGSKIACGGNKGNFYQCDTMGDVLNSWEGIRVVCLQYTNEGKSILAADTHHRIRSYNFDDLTDYTLIQEDHGIMSFTLDAADRYALLNIASQGIHMWDIESRILVRRFEGVTQGFCTIYSCFGGRGQNFIASGSEDNRVYIYHQKREKPIYVLTGHSKRVNCVDWNPVFPNILVSASDDSTIRVWGPSAEYRANGLNSAHSSTSSLGAASAATANGGSNQNGSATNGMV